jgi:hypothetical protein
MRSWGTIKRARNIRERSGVEGGYCVEVACRPDPDLRSIATLAASILIAGAATLAQDPGPPQQIVRKDVLTAVIDGRKDVARVEIKEIDLRPASGPACIGTRVRSWAMSRLER